MTTFSGSGAAAGAAAYPAGHPLLSIIWAHPNIKLMENTAITNMNTLFAVIAFIFKPPV
jgi:hypothetical protein